MGTGISKPDIVEVKALIASYLGIPPDKLEAYAIIGQSEMVTNIVSNVVHRDIPSLLTCAMMTVTDPRWVVEYNKTMERIHVFPKEAN